MAHRTIVANPNLPWAVTHIEHYPVNTLDRRTREILAEECILWLEVVYGIRDAHAATPLGVNRSREFMAAMEDDIAAVRDALKRIQNADHVQHARKGVTTKPYVDVCKPG